ncbi:MAG: sigma-70 family RNA polymerase sigma factor [Bacteroidota bacterium]
MSQTFFKTFVTENIDLIRHICRAYARNEEDLQDLMQEVTVQLWRSHKRFEGKSRVSTWVYRVALNVCLSQARKTKRQIQTYSLDTLDLAEEVSDEEKEQIELLYRAIRKLKESDRAIIVLYLEEKSYKEIAEILGMTISNVGVKVNRLKIQLKKMING